MSEIEKNISLLKRQIIATDKLLKHKNKSDAAVKTLTSNLQEKETFLLTKEREIVLLKSNLECKTASHDDSDEVLQLNNELEKLRKILHDKSSELDQFRKESEEKGKNYGQLENDLNKKKSRLEKVENEVKKKNADIIKRELECQHLKKEVEDLKYAKNNLEKDVSSGKAFDKMKESYEGAKWKNLSQISDLKQQNAALVLKVQELTKTNKSLKENPISPEKSLDSETKIQKLNENFERSLDKKSRIIDALQKKLDKAVKSVNKLQVKKKPLDVNPISSEESNVEHNDDMSMNISLDTSTEEVELSENEMDMDIEKAHTRKRLIFFNFSKLNRFVGGGSSKVVNQTRFKFHKVGNVASEESLLTMFNKPPVISDCLPSQAPEPSQPEKRKRQTQSFESPKTKRLKGSKSSPPENCPIPDSTSPHSQPILFSTPKPSSDTDNFALPLPPKPIHKLANDSFDESYSDPNPPKKRQAQGGIHQMSSKSCLTNQRNKSIKNDISVKSKPETSPKTIPLHLSPIKSPPISIKPKDEISPVRPLSMPLSPLKSPPIPTKIKDEISSVRSRVIAAINLAPQPVEARQPVHVGRLNPAQLEAAKRRAVPSVPFQPTVDGFRQSVHEGKGGVKNIYTNSGVEKIVNSSVKKHCNKQSEEKNNIQTRRKTKPNIVSSVSSQPEVNSNSMSNPKESLMVDENHEHCVIIKSNLQSNNKSSTYSKSSLSSNDDECSNATDNTSELQGNRVSEDEIIVQPSKVKDVSLANSASKSLDDDLDISDESDREIKETGGEGIEHENVEEKDKLIPDTESSDGKKKDALFNDKVLKVTDNINVNAIAKVVKHRNFLEDVWFGYKERSDIAKNDLETRRKILSRERAGFAYEANIDGMRKHFRNLMGSQNEDSFKRILDGLTNSNIPESSAMICDLVYEYLRAEHRETPLLNDQSDDNPAITRKQQRLFMLLVSLCQQSYPDILDKMLDLIWHGFFARDRMYYLKLNAVQNCGRMFILCARYKDDIQLVRHFLYDLFYFKSPRNHILIGIVVAIWPQVFPHSQSPLAKSPLITSLTWAVFNTGPSQKAPEMKVQATKDDFIQEYGFKPHSMKADELVIRFIKLAEGTRDCVILEDLTRCLLLLGRCKDYRWVNNNISNRLLKSLADVWSQGGDQVLLRWVLSTLGLISRVYPVDGRDQLKQLFEPVQNMLESGDLIKETETCCINALMHLGYHLQLQVAIFFKTWRPKHLPLDTKTKKLLEDFIGTRGEKYADKTMKVARNEDNRRRKRKGVVQ